MSHQDEPLVSAGAAMGPAAPHTRRAILFGKDLARGRFTKLKTLVFFFLFFFSFYNRNI
jgi:hypothetical protein